MKKEIKDLINRLRDHVGAAIVEHTDLVNDGRLLIDCLDASYELEEAYSIIDKMSKPCESIPSQSDTEPEKWLFGYRYVNSLNDGRGFGVVAAANQDEAKEILNNSFGVHCYISHIKKLALDDKGIGEIYYGYIEKGNF